MDKQRFKSRLSLACSAAGLAVDFSSRARQLTAICGWDGAASMLRGEVLPDWDVLLKMCTYFNLEPGYFLDSEVQSNHVNLITARSLTGGEPLLIRLPELRQHVNSMELFHYIQARPDMGFGVQAGDYLVSRQAKIETEDLSGLHCLIETDGDYELRYCAPHPSGRLLLHRDSNSTSSSVAMMVPRDARVFDGRHFGIVQCITRTALPKPSCIDLPTMHTW